MGFIGLVDRLFQQARPAVQPVPWVVPEADEKAVSQYARMLRDAPRGVIKHAHLEAFERLTPAQLDVLFDRLTAIAPTVGTRPLDALPRSLARSIAQADKGLSEGGEQWIVHALSDAALLDAVVWFSVVSAAWRSWNAQSGGFDDDRE
ncbi:hypothetical protein [Agromyces sp. ZXT2-6]|uniref:hypothetical protein n=1 Tax=Agromyces sp. ZXT2-6 TaxID=3461153 RepID=UPI004054E121